MTFLKKVASKVTKPKQKEKKDQQLKSVCEMLPNDSEAGLTD